MSAPGTTAGPAVIITGASSGIGRAAALQLAAHRRPLVLAVRNLARGEAVRDEIRRMEPDAVVDVLSLDLASLASVRDFAARFADRFAGWSALVNNAGEKMVPERRLTAERFELQFGTNHLGAFALTGLLMPFAAPGARVVTVTSLAARSGRLLFHDLRFDHGYRPMRAYAASKLANYLFARELDRRSVEEQLDVVSVAAHPGWAVADEQLRRLPDRLLGQNHASGAAPLVLGVLDPALRGGELIGPGGRLPSRGGAAVLKPWRVADEERIARRLWRLSGNLTRVVW